MLSLRAVRKSYGSREVVCGIDLELRAGECFGLLGPNGAGKTTTLRLALGLSEPDSGSISLLDHPIPQNAREARLRVGVLPQMDNLDPDFTVFENGAGNVVLEIAVFGQRRLAIMLRPGLNPARRCCITSPERISRGYAPEGGR